VNCAETAEMSFGMLCVVGPRKHRMPTGPGKSWNFGRPFSRPGKSWKTAKVMENDNNVMEFLQLY